MQLSSSPTSEYSQSWTGSYLYRSVTNYNRGCRNTYRSRSSENNKKVRDMEWASGYKIDHLEKHFNFDELIKHKNCLFYRETPRDIRYILEEGHKFAVIIQDNSSIHGDQHLTEVFYNELLPESRGFDTLDEAVDYAYNATKLH